MNLPIRIRLTVWYLIVLSITFLLFSVGMYLAMRGSIRRAVDAESVTPASPFPFQTCRMCLNASTAPIRLVPGNLEVLV